MNDEAKKGWRDRELLYEFIRLAESDKLDGGWDV
jgi:hypothetical protein